MVNVEFSEKHDERFEKHFSSQMDDITLILKCHLLLEEMLRDFCSEMVPQPQFLKDSRFTFAQILDLSRALYPADIKLGSMADLWSVCEKINRIRNMMAHALDPDSSKLESYKASIIEAIRLRGKGNTSSLEFAGCLTYVLGAFSLILQVGVTHKNGEDFRDIPRK
ncbi:hypothetical protein [Pseudomonas eucalypticola]|uniref:Uncharacterized protein n=1 Tax=Pseudomonas eucalypticola TaxID=2599595 RepID=A0A7D5D916_9PSED|nr:hypothetical protein [Pseudomonas eucalypticola]QKZ05878.1 hypothetical protein HWQ56_19635 [Pseudomonas eucalypticola]